MNFVKELENYNLIFNIQNKNNNNFDMFKKISLEKVNESQSLYNFNFVSKNKLKMKVRDNLKIKSNAKVFYSDVLKINNNIFKNKINYNDVDNINSNILLNKNVNIDHKLNKNMDLHNTVYNNNIYYNNTYKTNINNYPINCYRFKPSLILTEEEIKDDNLFSIEQQININNGNIQIQTSNNKNNDFFYLEKLFLEFKRNNAVINNFNHTEIKNDIDIKKELCVQNKINQMKKIITIKNCFFVFRNMTPVLYNCVKCSLTNCCHEFDKIDLPSNRILLKDMTTFLEIMEYPFTSNKHHRETKDFLKDELKINEYTNKYCSNIWLSSYFFKTIYKNNYFDTEKFIEKNFFQKYNLSLYLETMFGINIITE